MALGGGGVSLGSAFGEVIIDYQGALSGINQVQRGLGGLHGGFLGLNPVLAATGLGLAGIAGVAGGLGAVIGTSTGKAAQLEAQLDAVHAVSGGTADEMEQLRARLDELAIDPKLKVSAFEAADAMEMLARNGLSIQEITEGAARSTVLLANATGAQFGTAADIATDTMALFNIQAADMERAVDGITSVVNNSKFSIDDYRLALAQGGGVAATVGVEFDDFNTIIAGIAPLFASGSDAGTSFKVMLQRMVPTSAKAKGLMEELGIITEESGNRFFDAQGNLKSMADIAGILQETIGGLSEEQKNQALSTIFGTDAMRAAAGIAKLGADGYKELQTAMGDTSAADNAATRMDNLAGAMEILRGIIDAIQIRIGDKFIPLWTEMARNTSDFLSNNADRIVEFFGSIADGIERAQPYLFNFADTLLGAGDRLGEVLPGMIEGVTSFIDRMTAAFSEGGLSGLATEFWAWIDGPGGAQTTMEDRLNSLITNISDWLANSWPVIAAKLGEWSDRFWDWLLGPGGALERTGEALGNITGRIELWATDPATQERLAQLGEDLGSAMVDGIILVAQNDEKMGEFLNALLTTMWAAATSLKISFNEAGSSVAGGVLAGIIERITGEETSTELTTFLGGLWQTVVQTLIETLLPGLGVAFAIEQFTNIKDNFAKQNWLEIGDNLVQGIIDGIRSKIDDLVDSVRDMISAIPDTAKSLLGMHSPSTVGVGIGENWGLSVGQGVGKTIDSLANEVQNFASGLLAPGATAAATAGGGNVSNNSSTTTGDLIFYVSGDNAQDIVKQIRAELQNLFGLAYVPG